MAPKVSIVIPTFNRAYVLWRAVLSIQAQAEQDWELIIVDDGSTDGTARMAEEFNDKRIRYCRTENQGPSAARNFGVAQTSGDLIAYLDSDNVWRPYFLETLLGAAASKPGNVWYCGQVHTDWERTADGEWFLIERRDVPRKQFTSDGVFEMNVVDSNSMMHTRDAWEQVGGWDEECWWCEDWDLFVRIFLLDPDRAHWVEGLLSEYRQIFGEGADGICGEARENRAAEIKGRRYLLEKWKHKLRPRGIRRLSIAEDDLICMRADRS